MDKKIIVLSVMFAVAVIISTVVIYSDVDISRIETKSLTPILDRTQSKITNAEHDIERLKEIIINDIYHKDQTICNLSKKLFEIESENQTMVFINNVPTTVEDWHDNCMYNAERKNILLNNELLRDGLDD